MAGDRRDRVPPHSLDAETSVLGSILLQNNLLDVVLDTIKAEDFYSEANAKIFAEMMGLHRVGQPIDTVTVRERLTLAGVLEAVGGHDYLLGLTDTIPVAANVASHALIVKEKALIRALITACNTVVAEAFADYGNAQEFIDAAEKKIFDVCSIQTRSLVEPVKDVIVRAFDEISKMAHAGERVSGTRTGFLKIDDMTAGMHPGDLIIIAGRPAMGKTSFALNVAVNASDDRVRAGKPGGVAIFSLEMPKDQLVKRMLASEARVDATRLRTNQLDAQDWQHLAAAAGAISDLPILLDDTAGLNLMELRAKARRLMSQQGLCLIIIDYLQLMRSGTKSDNREQEISEISRSLKGLAKELGIPIIALSQLNRSLESRGDKRPMLSDLRESGAIEQDADTIWFVYRDEVYNKESPDVGIAEIIIGKQRAGPTGTCKVRFFNEYTRFENLSEMDDDRAVG